MRTISRGRIVAFLALVAALLAPFWLSHLGADVHKQEAHGEPTPAADGGDKPCPCDAQKTAGSAAAIPLPYRCIHFPIMVFDGAAIYQCERHAAENCQLPEVEYLYGSYAWPKECPDCEVPGYCSDKPSVGFLGLQYKIPHDYRHQLPKGRARTFSSEITTFPTGFNRYLRFNDVNGGPSPARVVKVFQFSCDYGRAALPPKASSLKTIYIAMECQEPPGTTIEDISDPLANRIPLRDPCHPQVPGCYAYRLHYKGEQILALIVGDDAVVE